MVPRTGIIYCVQREVVHLLYLPVLVLGFFVFDLSAFFFGPFAGGGGGGVLDACFLR